MSISMVRQGQKTVPICWGRNVTFNYNALEAACSRAVEPLDIELLRLCAAVALADRVFRRSSKKGWARQIKVTLGVESPRRWQRDEVKSALENCLAFVTGDDWDFEFVREPVPSVQLLLQHDLDYDVVVPFSGGLDSFLATRSLIASGHRPLRTTATMSSTVEKQAHEVSAEAVGLPVRLEPGHHPEPTYRSRTFMFATIAAVAARMSHAGNIVIGENGQGAIGAGLVSFGAEAPYRTTHPVFTTLYQRFLRALAGTAPVFHHPFVWRTKGSVLSELASNGHADGWEETRSCSRDLRRAKGIEEQRACGVCGNCILRRVSVYTAGLDDPTVYHWSLQGSLQSAQQSGGSTTKTDYAYAARNVLAMDELSRLPADSRRLVREAHLLASAEQGEVGEILEALRMLVQQHAEEWRRFLGSLPSSSWVLALTESNVVTT